jgi:hypothetical protein
MNIYFVASLDRFIKPIINELTARGYACTLSNQFDKNLAAQADVIWCEWADGNALTVQEYITTAKKIIRIHDYELYTNVWNTLNLKAFDHVIFVSNHKYEQAKRLLANPIPHAHVISNYINPQLFPGIAPGKERNNKIAYLGYICRKKGIGEIVLLAESLPEYEFHVAGEKQDGDIDWFLEKGKPNNLIIHGFVESVYNYFADKAYVLSPSMREAFSVSTVEGMLCGCKPIVRNWEGATDLYPQDCIFRSVDDVRRILEAEEDYNPHHYRAYATEHLHLDEVIPQIIGVIETKKEVSLERPTLTVGIIQTRQKYMGDLINSIKMQNYPLDIRIVQNFDKDMSIGRAYNKLADECNTDFIIYVGDDDWLADNYISSIMDAYVSRKNAYRNVIAMLTSTTAFDETGNYAVIPHHSTGVWATHVVRKHRFDETLVRQVDTEFHRRMMGLKEHGYTILQLTWLAGYMYRQHKNNISGNKFTEGANTSQEPVK